MHILERRLSAGTATAYADATRNAAPHAVQIADRWHLLRNLSEALKGALEPHHRILAQAAFTVRKPEVRPPSLALATPLVTQQSARNQQYREKRHDRYEQVMDLARQGTAIKKIARALDIDRRTVRRWVRSEGFPERKLVYRSSSIDAYASYLDQRRQEGCHNATQLWRELRELNSRGQVSIVRRWLRRRYGPRSGESKHIAKPPLIRASPRQTAWLMLTEPASASTYLKEIYRQSPQPGDFCTS